MEGGGGGMAFILNLCIENAVRYVYVYVHVCMTLHAKIAVPDSHWYPESFV